MYERERERIKLVNGANADEQKSRYETVPRALKGMTDLNSFRLRTRGESKGQTSRDSSGIKPRS